MLWRQQHACPRHSNTTDSQSGSSHIGESVPAPPPSDLTLDLCCLSDVMCLQMLRGHIYYSLCLPETTPTSSTALMEAMLNVMHATFVTLRSGPMLDKELLSRGKQTFLTLFSRYFKETVKVKVESPWQHRSCHILSHLVILSHVVTHILSQSHIVTSCHMLSHVIACCCRSLWGCCLCLPKALSSSLPMIAPGSLV